ncbi:gamma-glutamyltransferase [Candidatus Marinamargulisbacteria bacterium SCGC AG-343-D04]|nr:gamma-glutamyltransferase [Candidatus Marinamargulisbacteria bacterium SCGC AG-343-D04]
MLCLFYWLISSYSYPNLFDSSDIHHPVVGKHGMVVTEERLATQVGLDILKKGGNAVDAACAIGYTLAVTLPKAGNLAGGGFMMIYSKKDNRVYALDYREKAPKLSTKDLFLDEDGDVDSKKSRFSIYSAGVPGTVAGLEAAHQKFGLLSRRDVIQPAIDYAKKGFEMSAELSHSLKKRHDRLSQHESTRSVFYKQERNSVFYEPGEVFKQKDLAKTLTIIKKKGKKGFYQGDIAKKIVSYMEKNDGLITQSDLDDYEVKWREPIEGIYKGHRVVSMPPPSSGGIALVEALNIIENLELNTDEAHDPDNIHLISEALKFVYRDRAHYIGDMDFVEVPVEMLIDKTYAADMAAEISTSNVLKLDDPDAFMMNEGDNTTHFVVADRYGNVVSNTYTLNFSYGNGMVVEGTGMLLNNEMDDFSAKPGVPNAYGLVGNDKNAIAPEKRMLSSMSPTIVFKDEQPFLVTGSPGGSRIITTVLQMILNIVDYDMNVQEATVMPRFHHQWKPDEIRVERGVNATSLDILAKRGFIIKQGSTMGAAESIVLKDGYFFGSADPRKPNSLAEGY